MFEAGHGTSLAKQGASNCGGFCGDPGECGELRAERHDRRFPQCFQPRGEAWGDSENRQMLERAIEKGRGGIYLKLTPVALHLNQKNVSMWWVYCT
jgi:hypothetical protein